MKSFFSFFALFVALVSSVFVLGYNADNLLQKTADLSIQEWSWVSLSDHREAYPWVIYTRYVDGKQISDISTPGLLLDWNTFSEYIPDEGNNTKQRKIERTMKDDFQESKEYFANLSVINTAPQILDATVVSANLETIAYTFSAFDPALSDYPLATHINLETPEWVVLARQDYSLQDTKTFAWSFETDFARCNKKLILNFQVSDDIDSVAYAIPVYVDCPVSSTIKVENDMISSYIYSSTMSSTMYSVGWAQEIADHPISLSLYRDSFNILFSRGFLQAIALRRVIM
jgi:hypothetical protein